MPIVILIEVPDTIMDPNPRIGAIINAATSAGAKITVSHSRFADRHLPLAIAVGDG